MAYNSKAIKTDVNAKPIPQYYNPVTDEYEVLQGVGGAARQVLYGTDGQPISIVDNKLAVKAAELEAKIEALNAKLDGVIDGTTPAKTELTGSNLQDSQAIPVRYVLPEVVTYSKSNPLPPRTASDYQPRDTNIRMHWFPHVLRGYDPVDPTAVVNIYEQTIRICSTLDVPITVQFAPTLPSNYTQGYIYYEVSFSLPAGNEKKASAILVPEKGPLVPDAAHRTVYVMPELRGCYPAFRIGITAQSAPTVGEIWFDIVRRY